MTAVAIYSLKGGVGKTTIAVNLAFAASRSGRKTLLWDLDPQGGSTWLLGGDETVGSDARALFSKDIRPDRLIRSTAIKRLDLLPADPSLRTLDLFLHELDKKKRLAKLVETLAGDYDRIILDCPPGLTETSEQILRGTALIVVPVIPSPLSQHALGTLEAHLALEHGRDRPLMPVFSLVDRRRLLHRQALAAEPDWPVIPMASAVEAATLDRVPVGLSAPRSPASAAFKSLWSGIERRLAAK
ncbi:chromosome partitioning protein ParA [Sphingomonas oleivorans]|uniref:Chromosome partitioning protein ParA n=1 Tax=Sphingomonas oleivorans TaxID=1735121 RepID=A0A2T5FVB2_9SPHN|nr:ParA family protein [Sphingomonas oleivorans]PTQ09393.1 chromosome partitioning protein ParA [Sphingomonas oleivorans]